MWSLLAIGFISLLTVPVFAQQQSGVHLVLKFGRGMGTGFSDTAAVIPMSSLESCEEQGEKAVKKHKKDINTHYWCIEGTR